MQGADIILCSSDLVSFRVHKSILAISSPFFNDMFSLPQPCDDKVVDGYPLVHVSEDSELLHSLLTALYPIPSVIPESYEKTLALLSAAQKYDMSTALSKFRSEIGRQLPTTEDSFRAYAIASSKQLIPEMETAARLTLDHPMTFEAIGDGLPLFEGSAMRDLVRFRKRCHDKLLLFFEGFADGSNSLLEIWFGCTQNPFIFQSDKELFPGWFIDLISRFTEGLKEAYTNPFPKPSSLRKDFIATLLPHISMDECSDCSTGYATEGEAFLDELCCRVSKARDEVRIPSSVNIGLTSYAGTFRP
jgi:hypothetical protein